MGPRFGLDEVAKRKNNFLALAGNRIPVIQPVV
jgi:hypothetical protein